MRLPAAEVEWRREQDDSEVQSWWSILVVFAVIAAVIFGLITVGLYVEHRQRSHPQFYGDFRGGYSHGVDLKDSGHTRQECGQNLHGPYASQADHTERAAAWMFRSGCVRGFKGKRIGDVARRVNFLINGD